MASKLYRKFIKELQNWVAHGYRKHKHFSNRFGICVLHPLWLQDQKLSNSQGEWYEEELKRYLPSGLTPFNKDMNSYFYECEKQQIWQNIARREWLRSQQFKSDLLVEFMRELNSWIDRGMPKHAAFSPKQAICANYCVWVSIKNERDAWQIHRGELMRLFGKEGLHPDYPFNNTRIAFQDEGHFGEFWSNHARLEFIQRHTKHFLLKQL